MTAGGTWTREAPAKVNLGLFLGGVRPGDGRHELVTVFESLSLADSVSASVSESDSVVCPGVDGENLASRALALLRAAGWDGPPLAVEIVKRIPVAAGMAGGSADAAAVLGIAHAAQPVLPSLLEEVARALGADVPGQLRPGVTIGTGAGEVVERVAALPPHAFVVVPSPVGLATPDVFREADRLGLPRSADELTAVRDLLRDAVRSGEPIPDGLLVNDLQAAAVSLRPELAEVLRTVHAAGADHAMVSGSGPTVVGLRWGTGAQRWAVSAAQSLARWWPGAVAAEPVRRGFAQTRHVAG